MTLTPDEIRALDATSTPFEWTSVCDAVKAARGGDYPIDWYERVIKSGRLERAQARWHATEYHALKRALESKP